MNDANTPPLLEEKLAQTIVRYLGPKLGSFSIRGRSSGRDYRFSATAPLVWVCDEDLEFFEQNRDYRVLREHHHDPERERLERLIDARVAERVAATQTAPPRAPKKGGRPPVPRAELQELWHLRHHADPPQRPRQLAERFLDESYAVPAKAISERLWRFKRDHPELISEECCPFCAHEDA